MPQGYDSSRVTCETHSDRGRARAKARDLWKPALDCGTRTLGRPSGGHSKHRPADPTLGKTQASRRSAHLSEGRRPGSATRCLVGLRGTPISNVSIGGLFLTAVITSALGAVGVALLLGGVARKRHRRKAASAP